MQITEEISRAISASLKGRLGNVNHIRVNKPVSGGSVNSCYQVTVNGLRCFVKLNFAAAFPGMFEAEALGLSKIAATGAMHCPQVLAAGCTREAQFLVLEWIEEGTKDRSGMEIGGRNLAGLHRITSTAWGLDHNNYMGSLIQKNENCTSAAGFFIEKRLKPQVDLAVLKGLLDTETRSNFEKLYFRLHDLLPLELPAFVHGDLWSGNYLVSEEGTPYVIDPAIAFSHREADIAMTKLFGGFEEFFYSAYLETYPLEKGWQQRISLWNLYPLLIHLNLFGSAYLADIKQCLRRWV